jgi:hypothetical protein
MFRTPIESDVARDGQVAWKPSTKFQLMTLMSDTFVPATGATSHNEGATLGVGVGCIWFRTASTAKFSPCGVPWTVAAAALVPSVPVLAHGMVLQSMPVSVMTVLMHPPWSIVRFGIHASQSAAEVMLGDCTM